MFGTQTCRGVSCSTEAVVLGLGCFSASFGSSPVPLLPLVSPTCSTIAVGMDPCCSAGLAAPAGAAAAPCQGAASPWGRGGSGGALKGKGGALQASVEVCRELPFPLSQQEQVGGCGCSSQHGPRLAWAVGSRGHRAGVQLLLRSNVLVRADPLLQRHVCGAS